MFTPQEVSEKTFPKSARFNEGYQMAAVDEFLDSLTEDYTALFKDNVSLKAKLKVLAEKIEEYRSTEDSMRATLVTAQKMAAKLVQEAQTEKESMLADARKDAAVERAKLEAETEQVRRKMAMAQENLADFIKRSNDLISRQKTFLEALPEMDVSQMREDTVKPAMTDIDVEIRKAFEEEPVQPAPEEPKEPEQNSEIPSDFTLSLDELKFGKNYSISSEK
mgnify:CR=1 FL=1